MQRFTKIIAAILLTVAAVCVAGCNKDGGSGSGSGNNGNNDSDVRVTTYTPQDITQTSANCGGDVIVTQGLSLSEFGVCWSTRQNPTVDDARLSTIVWNEPFICTIMGLEFGKTYHVRAYALRGLECYYGEDKSFTTLISGGNGTYTGHEYVDLGLPSGTLWAMCNVGADAPEKYGDYYAWGETAPKANYNWNTYKYCNGGDGWNPDIHTLTKYCNNTDYGYNGFVDNLTVLQLADDPITTNWGVGWRLPTVEEWRELYDNTTRIWTTQNEMAGMLFTSNNGNSLFLPAAGYRRDYEYKDVGDYGVYWSSSLNTDCPDLAWCFNINLNHCGPGNNLRGAGQPVRAVRSIGHN